MKEQDFYQLIVENMPAVSWVSGKDGLSIFISPNVEAVYGFTPQEIYDGGEALWFGRIHEADREQVIQSFHELFAEKKEFSMDYRIRRKDGEWIWLRDKAIQVFVEDGSEMACGVFYDVTEQKALDEELRDSRERFADLAENSTDWIWEFDEHCIFTYSSQGVTRLLGYLPEEIVGRSAFDLIPSPEKEKVIKEFFLSQDRHAPFSHLENMNQHKDGSLVVLESSGTPIFDREGQFRGYRGIDRDISERKRMEEQMIRSQKKEVVGTLAGGIAHDFNNILSAILGYADLAQLELPPDSVVSSYLSEILQASHRARELVQQILSFSRKVEKEREVIHLIPIIEETVSFMRATLPTTIGIEKRISCETDTVLADSTQIHQVLINLCTNAAHAMEKDGGNCLIELSCSTLNSDMLSEYPEMKDIPYLQLSVSDTGPGINPRIMSNLFDPYFTTKPQGKGAGLGLAVVQGIVRSHEGVVMLDNRVGQGVTVHVFLPLISTSVEAPSPCQIEPVPDGTEHILFVDDEEAIVKLSTLSLEHLGYKVTPVMDSREALRLFQAAPETFDLIVTDQTMPGLTGSQLVKEILDVRPGFPVIICSGFSDVLDEKQACDLGAKSFLMKPVQRQVLAQAIRSALAD